MPPAWESELRAADHHLRRGELVAASEVSRRVVARWPDCGLAWHLLGMVALRQDLPDEAERHLRRACAVGPQVPEFHNSLGVCLAGRARGAEAIRSFQRAIQLRAGYVEAQRNLGHSLAREGRASDAEAAYRAALALRPDDEQTWQALAGARGGWGDLDGVAEACRRAAALRPDMADGIYRAAAAACERWGQAGRAVELRREHLARHPECRQTHSELLFSLHYVSPLDPARLFAQHLAWAHRFAPDRDAGQQAHDNDRAAGRPLRVGYVSPDFRDHPTAAFFEPILAAHDRSEVGIYCYAAYPGRADQTTARLRSMSPNWRDIAALDDGAAANLIRADAIDILVDLCGHGNYSRLGLFARRPAPVQATYLGYPDTTGLSAVDYRITDGVADPPGMTERFYSESLWRVPGCAWCWAPLPTRQATRPAEARRPAAGSVSFACFNRPAKASEAALRCWARILDELPAARLAILMDRRGEADPDRLQRWLGEHGLPVGRVQTLPTSPDRAEYLSQYNGADIALDPFPYNGMATTCDALFMGVPVITLAGETHVSRAGASLLAAAGLKELVAATAEQYAQIAVALANDPERLGAIRAALRERFAASALCDGRRVAQSLERAYRRMWERRLAGPLNG